MMSVPIWLLALLIVASVPTATAALCLAIALLFDLMDFIMEALDHDPRTPHNE